MNENPYVTVESTGGPYPGLASSNSNPADRYSRRAVCDADGTS